MQNYLEFQPVCGYCKTITNSEQIVVWKSNDMSEEGIEAPPTSSNSFNPTLEYIGKPQTQVKYDGSCLKQIILSFCIVYEIKFW